jgi:hypothetical protein
MTMRFLMLYRPADTEKAEAGVLPSREEIAEMGKFIEEMTNAGVLLATEGCQPTRKGARVRLSGGKVTVTDGPFTEAKELIAGLALVEATSKEEAVEWAKRFLKIAGDGESEIRQLHEPSDFCHDILPPEEAARAQPLRAEMQRKAAAR